MCASWNNAEIKIEKVSVEEVRLQAKRVFKEEFDNAIQDMKKVINSCEVKEGQTILEYVTQCENAINDICYSFRKVMLAFADSEACHSLVEGTFHKISYIIYNASSREFFLDLLKSVQRVLLGIMKVF